MSAIQTALQGLIRSSERLSKGAEQIAKGNVSADSIVAFKTSELDTKAQIKSLKTIQDTEQRLLDIIA